VPYPFHPPILQPSPSQRISRGGEGYFLSNSPLKMQESARIPNNPLPLFLTFGGRVIIMGGKKVLWKNGREDRPLTIFQGLNRGISQRIGGHAHAKTI
jgi:hypothetical protein